jgi:hypothetical protein
MNKIVISRKKDFFSIFRKYKIFIDNKDALSIRAGEEVSYETKKDELDLFVRIDWCESNKLKIKFGEEITKANVNIETQKKLKLFCFGVLFLVILNLILPIEILKYLIIAGGLGIISFLTVFRNKAILISKN